MKTIYLIRHGEAEANVDHSAYINRPHHSFRLTEKGEQQASLVGQVLADQLRGQNIAIYSSTYHRSLTTAEIARNEMTRSWGTVPPETIQDPRLNERDWGKFTSQEHLVQATIDHEADPFYFKNETGEDVKDVYLRVASFFQDYQAQKNTMVIFTHGEWIVTCMMYFLKFGVDGYLKFKEPKNGDGFVLQIHTDGEIICTPLKKSANQ